ncbi:MAG: PAS domain-containing protein [Acidisphaera sp.]|nr:PAS domain-containing protein [Acidisphaera sp.]
MAETAEAEASRDVQSPAQASADRVLAAIAMTHIPMLITDPSLPDNPIVMASPAFCKLTGYTQDELVGHNCRLLQGAGTDRETVARMHEALEQRVETSVEVLNYRKDGTAFWNSLYITPVFAPDGRLTHFFSSQADITGRRDTERALVQAQQMAGLGCVTGGIAHEFNNLLTVIHGNLEPMLAEASEQRTTRRLQRVAEAADRAAFLTRSMVAFARRQRLEDATIDISALLLSLRAAFARLLGPAHRLVFDFDRQPCLVQADAAQLRTALSNVLMNARDAMPEGGRIKLSIRGKRTRAGRLIEVAITVQDTGRGMPPEVVARAFEPFFTTKEPGTAAGLGLSMAYGFVRQSGGRLELESREGVGTSVRMVFPNRAPASDALPRARAGETVLVVDEDDDLRQQCVAMLRDLGYAVAAAASPAEALGQLRDGREVDLVISDREIPGIGAELRVLRAGGVPTPEGAEVLARPYALLALARQVRGGLDHPPARLAEPPGD